MASIAWKIAVLALVLCVAGARGAQEEEESQPQGPWWGFDFDFNTPNPTEAQLECLVKMFNRSTNAIFIWNGVSAPTASVSVFNTNTLKAGGSTDAQVQIQPMQEPTGGHNYTSTIAMIKAFVPLASEQYVWLRIMDSKNCDKGSCWSSNAATNVAYIKQLAADIGSDPKNPISVAIITSKADWQTITGNSMEFSTLSLWYIAMNSQPNFNDYTPFGGWTIPYMKQYAQKQFVCGVTVNLDWERQQS